MSERRYWLMKSEPSCFSFDDLKARPDSTEHWDGVRNFQARGYLKDEMKVGDRAFFYHSNIADPAIVGIVEVVKAGYPDWTAFDPENEHFDPRGSKEKPLWFMVDVRYVAPLPRPVTLRELKGVPEVGDMVLLKRGRLSVQPVREEEWRAILRLAGMQEEP
ncbi:EVE domain-containing protein [Geomonas sp. RF6]|uniref:EVE domain-containing protein n=1 Tax=Geomonas sp. RF6 TaxID=2897342 RepID=UPI001E4F6C87|nr:EVE domain-containing protein [Geomonas sp. RF6]UFS72565.1 EVE domain-containing protein [Geomonas sp. RF6]